MKKTLGILLRVLLLVLPYVCWMFMGMAMKIEAFAAGYTDTGAATAPLVAAAVIYLVISVANIIYVIYETRSGADSEDLLFWTMLTKLCYIPLFIWMFVCMFLGFATFMLGGILMVAFAVIIDVMFLIPPSVCGLCGCIRAVKEGNVQKGLSVTMAILHFVFCLDVVAAIVMYFTVRNAKKRQRNAGLYGTRNNG